MTRDALRDLAALGQSVWLDVVQRGTVASGQLARWIADDGIRGVTTNPTLFEAAILESESHDYDEALHVLASRGLSAAEIYEALTVHDVQLAADAFRGIYEALDGRDGFVSLEVSPRLAHDTDATVAQASHLWTTVDRPNLMIEVPATAEGLPAISRLLARGINVNATLLFGLDRYAAVVDAFFAGLEARLAGGGAIERVASVASFFLSRIDAVVDAQAQELRGEAAIASAKLAYAHYLAAHTGGRFGALSRVGARPQRLLWASTATKDPRSSDVKYVEALIGPDTIDTMPRHTFDAFRDHGVAEATLERDLDHARRVMARLRDRGLDLAATSRRLEDDGVAKVEQSYDRLLDGIEARRLGVPRRAS